MNSLSVSPTRHAMAEQSLTYAAICRAMPRNAHVILDNLPQSTLAILLDNLGMSYDIIVTEPVLAKYGFKLVDMLERAKLPMVCLGSQTYQIQLTPRLEAGFSELARASHIVNVQTVDDAFLGLRRVNWLAMGDANLAFLDGAKRCITEHRPLISFTFNGRITDLLQWCETNQYAAVDASLAAVTSDSSSNKCFLFPSRELLRVACDYLASEELSDNSMLPSRRNGTNKQQALYEHTDVLAQDYLSAGSKPYSLASIMASGLYATELNDNIQWRWTGPGHDTLILLPLDAKGVWRLSFTVFALPKGLETNTIRCFINGIQVSCQKVQAGSEIVLDFFVEKPELPLELLLSTSETVTCGERALGVAISGLQLAWNLSE